MSSVDLIPRYYRCHARLSEARAERLCERVTDLRVSGLSFAAISAVLAIYESVLISEDEARSWCSRLGLPKNPNKARLRAVTA